MRGKAGDMRVPVLLGRNTPAYAGKSMLSLQSLHHRRDHPRLCGEKFIMAMEKNKVKGSPPPMRGKAVDTSFLEQYLRITPAYAGKSVTKKSMVCGEKDHPRLCGEKSLHCTKIIQLLGSPPPMRGKVNCRQYFADNIWDHPRLCGEKMSIITSW